MFDVALKVEKVATAENYGRFKIEPLEPGYGITLGNALRRILLSSLPGAAVSSIKIDGVAHEFASLPHVKEDVTEIILNVKRIRLRSFSDRPVRLNLSARGQHVVTAGEIEVPGQLIEIINVDQPIATLDSEDATLDMELTVEHGVGYNSAENRDNMPIGVIPVDAIYTPIPRVNYVVEHTRVGQQTDYDRLIIEIWTDGSVDAGESLSQSAQILKRHSEIIADFNKSKEDIRDGASGTNTSIPPQTFDTPIEDLNLSVRTYNCLKRSNITKVGQILQMDEKDLLSVRNFGRKSYDELRAQLINHGYMSSASPIGPFAGTASGVGGFGEDEEGTPIGEATFEEDNDDADED
ncbi:MAG: DNA-directed RNA polymerase subunit alpha [Chloroflexota bacterium]|nr:DNA-directed RNA polymerase subunit alpha [Chloroflexota bacterium]